MYKRTLVAVDIGNSGIKLGQFTPESSRDTGAIPEPIATFEIPISNHLGSFESKPLAGWCEEHIVPDTQWLVATVHRRAGTSFVEAITGMARGAKADWSIRCLTYRDVRLAIHIEEPARVGIDRLLAAVAANRLRQPGRAAIIVDLGTAITVDLVDEDGAFAGGAILPGIGMSSRALAEQTDALPHVAMEQLEKPPSPLGKSTEAAIQAGLYWGVVGAIRELVSRLTAELSQPPELFVTGGASQKVAELLAQHGAVRHVPHLVLAGVALVNAQTPGRAGG